MVDHNDQSYWSNTALNLLFSFFQNLVASNEIIWSILKIRAYWNKTPSTTLFSSIAMSYSQSSDWSSDSTANLHPSSSLPKINAWTEDEEENRWRPYCFDLCVVVVCTRPVCQCLFRTPNGKTRGAMLCQSCILGGILGLLLGGVVLATVLTLSLRRTTTTTTMTATTAHASQCKDVGTSFRCTLRHSYHTYTLMSLEWNFRQLRYCSFSNFNNRYVIDRWVWSSTLRCQICDHYSIHLV